MKKVLAVVAVVGLAGAAHAGRQNDAGCGLGSMLFTEDKPVHQIVAATTNGSFGNQTFGITTGTLGCSSGGLIKAGMEREVFVATNYRALEKEMAAGKGQYAKSLSTLIGCGEQTGRFLDVSKRNYETLFTEDGDAKALLRNLDAQIASDPVLKAGCGA